MAGGQIVDVQDLAVGSVLADAVISPKGKVLLGKGVELTGRHIHLLQTWNISHVYIAGQEEPCDEREEEKGPLPSRQQIFEEEYGYVSNNVQQAFEFIRKQKLIPVPALKDSAYDIHRLLLSNRSVITCLVAAQESPMTDFILQHSMKVAFLASFIARQLRWNDQEVRDVALASLLHHAGNIMVQDDEVAHNKAYIAEAAAMLRKTKGLSGETILGIVQHREHVDGTGFPTGVDGNRIHPYAKVIAVADAFHARACQNKFGAPFSSLDFLSKEMFGKLDPVICNVFISRFQDDLLQNKIILADGKEAEIVYFRPNGSNMPVVRTVDNQIIDLSQQGFSAIHRVAVSF
ncbi:HD-GYP domain-containing protein [Propionispora vibrioides]|uniref:HD-GYP domain, c-di-GMP phosphodiesterase class II (Or its inactivated variant) n=1 Tax=Propionispora vibrioides TaxID=112903 RepID=A0A1H8QZI1_9FIRM|nr:HD domain-containing phosphohydrolase [Propionispora vibrioides]SEO59417.1 HD-GYP domain, c-di-GMP phosphodiesterase class II (or its inactivated variant) [Propionispora vibrioides]